MIRLVDDDAPFITQKEVEMLQGIELDNQGIQEYILTRLAIDFSDDIDFLRKINKITFGLISGK